MFEAYKEMNFLNFFYNMLDNIPLALINEGKKLKDKEIKKYINQLDEMNEKLKTSIVENMLNSDLGSRYGTYLPFYFDIKDEKDFHRSFEVLLSIQTKFDLEDNPVAVNQLAWFMVKYYGEHIIKYGNDKEKALFVNNIKLLKLSKLIN